MIESIFWSIWWDIKTIFWRVQCWFKGHNEVRTSLSPEEYLQGNYCDRCYIDWPDEHNTLPMILNRSYIWVVEREWTWFEKLDIYLCENHSKRLPNWWSY